MTHFIVVANVDHMNIIENLISQFSHSSSDVEVLEAGGKNYAYSLARSLVVEEGSPVAVVLDANTEGAEHVRDQEINFDDLVTSLPGNAPLELILAVPNLHVSIHKKEWRQKLADFLNSDELNFKRGFSFRPR